MRKLNNKKLGEFLKELTEGKNARYPMGIDAKTIRILLEFADWLDNQSDLAEIVNSDKERGK